MADLETINAEIATIEVLEAYRARLKQVEAGVPSPLGFTADDLRRTIADLEAQMASSPKE